MRQNIPEPDDDIVVIFCLPTSVPKNLSTAVIGKCARCHQKIWVAPTTLELIKTRSRDKIQTVCLDCMTTINDEARQNGGTVEMGLVPGSLEEFADQLAKDRASKNN